MIVEKLKIHRCDVKSYGTKLCDSPATHSVEHKSAIRLVCNSHIASAIEEFEVADPAIEETE